MASNTRTLADALHPGEHAAIIDVKSGQTLPASSLRSLVLSAAATLRASGVQPGQTVSIVDANTVEFVVAFLGVTLARAIAAPLNASYSQDEFQFYFEDAQTKLVLVPGKGNPKAEGAAKAFKVPVASLAVNFGTGTPSVSLSARSQGLQIRSGGAVPPDTAQPDDVALLLHTSGTTSRPKAVPLSHGNLRASLTNIAATYQLSGRDRSLLVMPLFHVHGLMAGLLGPLAATSAVILPAAGGFSARTFWQDAVAHGATFYTAVPTMHQILLARAQQDYPADKPPPLRFIRSCSSALAAATLHKVEAAFHAPVLEAYAMTEASHQMTSNPLPQNGPHKPGTVGRAQGTVKVAVLDGSNQPVQAGKIGEVCIRGPNVTAGYLNNPAANKEAFAGGWLHTGDQGFLDAEGYLTLTGRLKELINRGGEKISPIEVDGALLSHPDVAEAVSFGAPDDKYGEIVAAAIVPSKPVGDPQAFIAAVQQHAASKLAKFKVPVKVFITDKLPKTATGKIQRRHMVTAFITKPQEGSQGADKAQNSAEKARKAASSAAPPKGTGAFQHPPMSKL